MNTASMGYVFPGYGFPDMGSVVRVGLNSMRMELSFGVGQLKDMLNKL
jgi:hypothetical protein